MDKVRLDKYLWAIRVFKTRSEAADACNGNKVRLNGVPAKASKEVKIGDLIEACPSVRRRQAPRLGEREGPCAPRNHCPSKGSRYRKAYQERTTPDR